jgi:hypothetical protein
MSGILESIENAGKALIEDLKEVFTGEEAKAKEEVDTTVADTAAAVETKAEGNEKAAADAAPSSTEPAAGSSSTSAA